MKTFPTRADQGTPPRSRPSKVVRSRRSLRTAALERLEDRAVPAVLLDVDPTGNLTYTEQSAGVVNNLTVSTTGPAGTYTFSDTGTTITLGAGASARGFTVAGNTASGPDSSVSHILIDTNDGSDVIKVQSIDAPTVVNPTNGGAETLTVGDATGVGNLRASLSVMNTAGQTAVTVDNSPGTAAQTVSLSATQLTFSTVAKPITFQPGRLTSLHVLGGGGGNTFNVTGTPGFGVTTIDTGAAGSAGNAVNVQAAGSPVVINSQAPDAVTLGASGVLTGLTSSLTLTGTPTTLTVDGSSDPAAQNLTLSASGASDTLSGLPGSVVFDPATLHQLTLMTGTGTNAVAVSFNGGNPLPAGNSSAEPFPGGLNLTGGSGTTALTLSGGAGLFSQETHTPSGNGSGSLAFTPGGSGVAAPPVEFTGLTRLDDTVPVGTYSFSAPAASGNQSIAVVDGPVVGGVQTVTYRDAATSGTSGFVPVNFANKSAVRLTNAGGDATITLNNATAAAGETSMTTTTGPGADVVNVKKTPAGVATSVSTDGGNDTVNVSAAGLGPGTTLTLDGGDGAGDVLNLDATGQTSANTATPGRATFNPSTGTVTYSNFERVNVTGLTDQPLAAAPTTVAATAGVEVVHVVVATFTDADPNARAEDFVASINWGDGSPTSAGEVLADGTLRFDVLGSHTYASPGTFTITTTITDQGSTGSTTSGGTTVTTSDSGGSTATATSSAVVTQPSVSSIAINPAPAVAGAVEGTALTNVPLATFTEADPTATTAGLTATIDWGDGSPQSAGIITQPGGPGTPFTVSGTHTYAESNPATLPVIVTVTDASNRRATVTATVSGVADAALTNPLGLAVSAEEGRPLNNVPVATFTDANPQATVSDFAATVNWGDGTTTPGIVTLVGGTATGTNFQVSGGHTYQRAGTFPVSVSVADSGGQSFTLGVFNQTALVSNTAGNAAVTDTNLVNPWGLVAGPTSPFWVSDNGTGVSTLYNGNTGAANPLVVTIPAPPSAGGGHSAPTGVVFNGVPTDFLVSGTGTPARFIFATEDGTIAAWNAGTTAVLKVDNSASSAVYKGLALAGNGGADYLYAANFRAGTVDVFDNTFAPVSPTAAGFAPAASRFVDPNVPAGFAPFGIQAINGNIYVTYAKQDAAKHDDVRGAGNGYVDVFTTAGTLSQRLVSNGALNSPWGLALAPASFGTFGNDLLVGNFGNGVINAYDPTSGNYVGTVASNTGAPIDGLWGLAFGNGGAAGPRNTLFFTAGPNGESGGLFGSITASAAPAAQATVAAAPVTATGGAFTGVEGLPSSGLVASFTDANAGAVAGDFTTTIDWGDNTVTSTGAVTGSGTTNGQTFRVNATHVYAESGTYPVVVTIRSTSGAEAVASTLAVIADAPLVAGTQTVPTVTEGTTLTRAPVASFTDTNPNADLGDFMAMIDWGDGSPQSAGTVTQPGGVGTPFVVTGTHAVGDSGVNGGTGTLPITVYVNDSGGSRLTLTNTLSVQDVPINLTGRLDPSSDTGASAFDGITNNPRPVFFGSSEALSTIRLIATSPTVNGGNPFVIGQGTADASGRYSITTNGLPDGTYRVSAQATDASGHTTATANLPAGLNGGPLVIDTVGPRVTNALFGRLTGQVLVTLQDDRAGLDQSTLLDSQNFQLSKRNAGTTTYLVTGLIPSPVGAGSDAQNLLVTFNTGRSLRGGNYTFTVRSGGVRDLAGNALDGEFYGTFPSGNGTPGGDFVTRLTAMHRRVFGALPVFGTATPNSTPGQTPGTVFVRKAAARNVALAAAHARPKAAAHVRVSPAPAHSRAATHRKP